MNNEDYYDYLEADDIAIRELQEEQELECWENDYDALQQENKKLQEEVRNVNKGLQKVMERRNIYKRRYLKCRRELDKYKHITEIEQLQSQLQEKEEDIGHLIDIINHNCQELKCTSDEWLVIKMYQDRRDK